MPARTYFSRKWPMQSNSAHSDFLQLRVTECYARCKSFSGNPAPWTGTNEYAQPTTEWPSAITPNGSIRCKANGTISSKYLRWNVCYVRYVQENTSSILVAGLEFCRPI